jgi:DNA topoisomerase-1
MAPRVNETKSVRIRRRRIYSSRVRLEAEVPRFLSVYSGQFGEEKEENDHLGEISEESSWTLDHFDREQHFTQPPAHYTEASLVKTMEELGIGRPSTYAPTITTIIAAALRIARTEKTVYDGARRGGQQDDEGSFPHYRGC